MTVNALMDTASGSAPFQAVLSVTVGRFKGHCQWQWATVLLWALKSANAVPSDAPEDSKLSHGRGRKQIPEPLHLPTPRPPLSLTGAKSPSAQARKFLIAFPAFGPSPLKWKPPEDL